MSIPQVLVLREVGREAWKLYKLNRERLKNSAKIVVDKPQKIEGKDTKKVIRGFVVFVCVEITERKNEKEAKGKELQKNWAPIQKRCRKMKSPDPPPQSLSSSLHDLSWRSKRKESQSSSLPRTTTPPKSSHPSPFHHGGTYNTRFMNTLSSLPSLQVVLARGALIYHGAPPLCVCNVFFKGLLLSCLVRLKVGEKTAVSVKNSVSKDSHVW